MNSDQIIEAADCLKRLTACESALDDAKNVGCLHSLWLQLWTPRAWDGRVYYPRDRYVAILEGLIAAEKRELARLGVDL